MAKQLAEKLSKQDWDALIYNQGRLAAVESGAVPMTLEQAAAIIEEDIRFTRDLLIKYEIDPAENWEMSATTGWITLVDE